MEKAKNLYNIISLQHECKNPQQDSIRIISYWCFVFGWNIIYEEMLRPGRPYYSTILMVQLFIIKSWMRIPRRFIIFYQSNVIDKLFKVCKLTQIPDRRTIDRRFQNLPIGDIIGTMGCI